MLFSGKAEALCVDPARVERFLPVATPFIRRAVTRCGDWSEDEIAFGLIDGSMLLWLVCIGKEIIGACVTRLEIRSNKPGRMCHVLLVGGDDMRIWLHLIEEIENYARNEGCVVVRWGGREGWKRMFPDYKVAFVTLEKELG